MPLHIMQPNKSCTEAIVCVRTNRHLHGKGERNGTQWGTKVEKKSHIQFDCTPNQCRQMVKVKVWLVLGMAGNLK